MTGEITTKAQLCRQFLVERAKKPLNHPEFIIYFLFFTIGIGAIDIWAAIYILNGSAVPHDYQHLRISIIGFSIVLVCSGAVDLIFSTEKYIRRIIQLSAVTLIILGLVIFFVFFNNDSCLSFVVTILWSIISLFVWWIANAENSNIIGADLIDEMSDETKKLGDTLTDLEK